MKNDKKKTQFIALILFSLFLTIPFVSALSFGSVIKSIGTTIKNVVNKVITTVKNIFTGGSSSSSSGSSGTNTKSNTIGTSPSSSGSVSGGGSSGGSSGTYNPWGQGTLAAPTVVQDPSYTLLAPSGGALYHDVDLGRISLQCINCPSTNPNVAGFDYMLNVELINKGNNIAQDVDLYVSITMPDGEKRDYNFNNNKLWINPGAYTFRFPVSSIGVDSKTRLIKPWAISKGTTSSATLTLYAKVTNDKGIDRKEIRYKVTPQRQCSWAWNGLVPTYSCKEIEPLTETYEVDMTIEDSPSENEVKDIAVLNTLSAELWAGGKLASP